MMYNNRIKRNLIIFTYIIGCSLLFLAVSSDSAFAADVITNGTFDSDFVGWTDASSGSGTIGIDNSNFGNLAGSIRGLTDTNRNRTYTLNISQSIGNVNSSDNVYLSLWWYKSSVSSQAATNNMIVTIFKPSGDSANIWLDATLPAAGSSLTGNVNALDVSSFFDQNGSYTIRLLADLGTGNDKNANTQSNFDDVILDVQPAVANNAPTVTAGVTAVSISPVNNAGTNTTVISTQFSDSDLPGIGAFNVTFKIREPNDLTELTLVNNQPNGGGGLTITDQGGGNYTASFTYNPSDVQAIGLYDLYFEVTDGVDNAIDGYANNTDELEIYDFSIPTGGTQTSVPSVNRQGSNTTVISAAFVDSDQPGITAFNVTFKVREKNNINELILVNNLTNGNGGLTITDQGGGNYTASYTWDPNIAQDTGFYDLYCEVFNGSETAIDDYTLNNNELEVVDVFINSPPSFIAGATSVSKSPVGRSGTDATTLFCNFSDTDDPGINAFTITFKVRRPDNSTEEILVNALTHGNGGLNISNLGGGSYRAEYSWDPPNSQTLGLYDLYFEVSDGTDNAIDIYDNNLDEVEVLNTVANQLPTVTNGATAVSVPSVNRFGNFTTVLSAQFSDADLPGVNAFNITFKVREPNNTTELTLVNNLSNGVGGLTISDLGGGTYEASYTYDPDAAQTLGLYDLYFQVSDGTDIATDDYTNNLDELDIFETIINDAPVIAVGATQVSVSTVNRYSNFTTVISAEFTDTDIPGIGAFNVTFKIREPNDITELILVNNVPHGSGGLTITDLGSGAYRAEYTYDPIATQIEGFYDLYCEVTDGYDTDIDGYANNSNELFINEIIINNVPAFTAGITSVIPSSIDRLGANTVVLSASFYDADQPALNEMFVRIAILAPYEQGSFVIADSLQNGQGGLTITDNGGGNYSTQITWDPPDGQPLGYYNLYCGAFDGSDWGFDAYANNPAELLITNGGENIIPVVQSSATFATPAGIERIGVNPTTISTTFTDGDIPGVAEFSVTYKLRKPDDSTEIILADNAINGTQGVTISDLGSGIYDASISWDPADTDTLGFYDLYFMVKDASDSTIDRFINNEDELELYDATSNNAPTVVAGNTFALPDSLTRLGSDFTMVKSTFTDVDRPGTGAFTITIKVRDQGSIQYTLVDAAKHGQQGLRVVDVTGGNYEASVLWEPPDAQPTGTYDLYFYVEDNFAQSAVDDYVNNQDELNVTNEAILGDGNILRRNNNSDNCGGAASACHNVLGHMGNDCLTCHTPHSTPNIYLIRDSIQTPSSGLREVIFKTLGTGDPYNDPDPVIGDPNSGVMADDTDGAHTGVCEVCHSSTNLSRHSNDDTHSDQGHKNAQICSSCHLHSEGFPNLEAGGGESGGGVACTCHSDLFSPMNTSTTTYHHQINSDAADYAAASKTCLMCHVDHNIFRDDLNVGFGQRGRNLRASINITPVQGDATVLSNSDYSSSGDGGICLSCHTSQQTKGYAHPDGSTVTMVIDKPDFDAATQTHNYNVPITITNGSSTFNGNCVKCHSDEFSIQYQDAGTQFGMHNTAYRKGLNDIGAASPTDPMEEKLCFQCHSTTSNPNAGSSLDYYGVKAMSSTSLRIEDAFNKTYAHPVTNSGLHNSYISTEGPAQLGDGSRHAECVDCHVVHEALKGNHDGYSSLVSNPLKGVWGVEPTSWPTPPAPTNNANVYVAPSEYSVVNPAQYEYQICLKCHSNYVTLPAGKRNIAEEINPNYPSTHGITIANQNPFCNTSTMKDPWGSSGLAYCSDCHRSDVSTDPNGPHGSNQAALLVATATSNDVVGTPLCYTCHLETVYWSDRNAGANSRYGKHPSVQGSHMFSAGCFSCHMWDHATLPSTGITNQSDWTGPGSIKLNVHGSNRWWIYNELNGTAGSQDSADAFVNGYIANIDYAAKQCWTETCKEHSPQSY